MSLSAIGRSLREPWLWRCACAVSSGALLASAFPPIASADGAWMALVPLLVVLRWTPPAQSFGWGCLAGGVFWLFNLAWLLKLGVTGAPWALIVPGWLFLSAYCALYIGAFAACASAAFVLVGSPNEAEATKDSPDTADADETIVAIPPLFRIRNLGLLIVIPALWIGFEYWRAVLFTGFPWNALGISQFRNVTVIQLAAWAGVYAVSGLLVVMNTALTLVVLRVVDMCRRRKTPRFQIEMAAALLMLGAAWYQGMVAVNRVRAEDRERTPVRVAAVQPAIPQMKKWAAGFEREIYNSLESQTRLAMMGNPDLVVWPETAVPTAMESDPECQAFVASFTTQGMPLLVGTLEYEPGEPGAYDACFNSSLLVHPDGSVAARYRKQHLVPFGEYLPLDKRIPFIQRLAPLGFSCTAGRESTCFRLEASGAVFSVLICFEDIFAGLAREAVRKGAELLINQTNDAWFDGTSGPVQHLAHCVFRCVENRVPAVRVANSGVTCFIDRSGLIEDSAALAGRDWDLGVPGFKTSSVRLRSAEDPPTGYSRNGDWALALPCGIASAAFAIVVGWKERQRRRDESDRTPVAAGRDAK